jgi:hypothetical protein
VVRVFSLPPAPQPSIFSQKTPKNNAKHRFLSPIPEDQFIQKYRWPLHFRTEEIGPHLMSDSWLQNQFYLSQ